MKPTTNRLELTSPFCKTARADRRTVFWDSVVRALGLRLTKSGGRSFVCVYQHRGRSRWFTIGRTDRIGLSDARTAAKRIIAKVVLGGDPATDKIAERAAARQGDTLAQLCERYTEQVAKKRQRSWAHGEQLRKRHVLVHLGKRKAAEVTRQDLERIFDAITTRAPIMANAVIDQMSGVFAWAVQKGLLPLNPCAGIVRNPTASRDRVLTDEEVKVFWEALDNIDDVEAAALKLVLLSGARPGEVRFMRQADLQIGSFTFEHHRPGGRVEKVEAKGGWWTLLGEPQEGWPGTKNSKPHRVWLPEAVVEILRPLLERRGTHVFQRDGRQIGELSVIMREVVDAIGWSGAKVAKPHDLRRSFGTTVTAIGFTREQMDRMLNHVQSGVGGVYDRHGYQAENRTIAEAACARLLALAEGHQDADNVVDMARKAEPEMAVAS